MDSLRLPKNNTNCGSKSPSGGIGIPIGVKFNAGEEIIEDILKPPNENQNQSLSNSPMQNIEDFNWRKEILQGGFFNRKRSSSIEGNKSGGILSNSTSSCVISSTNTTNQNNNSSVSDGTTSSNLVSNLAVIDNSSVGTWKLIKGKVSQAMEDIKSSKTAQTQIQSKEIVNEDSEVGEIGTLTVNPENVSGNDLNALNTVSTSTLPIGYNLSTLKTQHKYFGFSRRSNKSDTDSEDESEVPSVVEDLIESSSLRKSLANLKSKAKTHLAGTSTVSTSSGKCSILTSSDISEAKSSATTLTTSVLTSISTSNPSSTSSLNLGSGIRSTFLRKRIKKQSDKISPPSNTPSGTTPNEQQSQKSLKKTKKEFEIESGVEMFEDMELLNITNNDLHSNDQSLLNELINESNPQQEELRISLSTDTISFRKPSVNLLHHQKTVSNLFLASKQDQSKVDSLAINTTINNKQESKNLINSNTDKIESFKNFMEIIRAEILKILLNSNFIMTGILLMILIIAPIAEFFRGIIACLCIITFFNTFSEYFWKFLNEKIQNINVSYFGDGLNNANYSNNIIGPQRCKFEVPDYSKMNICEIPVIEEHKSLKVYSGWMNEINNYDPNNFHQSMTRSVYIRLDGSILRILNTSTRIAKRSMWNESPIDRKNIIFTCSRTFNLIGARVEMLPRGLARKRYFSRKYPMQLIIKNYENQKSFPDDELMSLSTIENIPPCKSNDNFKTLDKNNISINKTLTEENEDMNNKSYPTLSNSLTSDNNRFVTHQNSSESNEELRVNNNSSDSQNNDLDFGSLLNDIDLLLNSDLQNLQNTHDPIALKETIPCGDETRILLFARCDREKEDWYRRFYSASIGAIHDQDLKISDIVMITDEEVSQALKATHISSIDQSTENCNQNNESIKNNSNEKDSKDQLPNQNNSNNSVNVSNSSSCDNEKINSVPIEEASTFEGLLFSTDAARNSPEYIKFMSRYQKACTQKKIPVVKSSLVPSETPTKRNRRQKRQEDELWKGINQSLYLGPSGSIIWANVLIGRILFSCLNDSILLEKIQDFLQRKLSAIRLPSFMEDVSIANINLGDTPPLMHRISQPQLDERGTWIDADVTYEGLIHMTITTKLNLLRLKRSQHTGGINSSTYHNTSSGNQLVTTNASTTVNNSRPSATVADRSNLNNTANVVGGSTSPTDNNSGNFVTTANITGTGTNISSNNNISPTANVPNSSLIENGKSSPTKTISDNINLNENENSTFISNLINANLNSDCNSQNCSNANSAIYDSNAESSGASSSESESPTTGSAFDVSSESQSFHPSPGSSRRFLRIVDRITASNIFQSATEISYIQRAMENMSTKITLRVELKGLVSRIVFNIPPPPSDRIWLAFRGPPRLWISAKPAVGDHAFDWSVVTNVIENKLCDEVYKYLVYPNMVDIIVPFLGQSTYKE